jgi:hypothetical protein
MRITASNGIDYDLENLSESDRKILQLLGHLPKSDVVESTTEVLSERNTNVPEDAIKKSKKNESAKL